MPRFAQIEDHAHNFIVLGNSVPSPRRRTHRCSTSEASGIVHTTRRESGRAGQPREVRLGAFCFESFIPIYQHHMTHEVDTHRYEFETDARQRVELSYEHAVQHDK